MIRRRVARWPLVGGPLAPSGTVAPVPHDRLDSLVSPYGVVSRVRRRRPARGLGSVHVWVASAGLGSSQHGHARAFPAGQLVGAGLHGHDPERAQLVAIAEAAERYAAGDFLGEPVRWARARDLDGAVIGPESVPRCSAAELASSGCPLTALTGDAVIRWVRGIDLASGEPVWLPAIMACYGLRDIRPAERFWYRISTGYAVHTDPGEAVVRGLCEVIERDAIALTWLQRLPLPPLPGHGRSDLTGELLVWCERHFVRTYLFDATTDMEVPTVYCLQVAEFDTSMRQAVSCATGRTIAAAAEKALLEVLRYRLPGMEPPETPPDRSQFRDITHGAAFMGRPQMAPAFGFLTDGEGRRTAPPRPRLPGEPSRALDAIMATLAGKGMRAVVVDRTPRELADAGLTAVCVVVPGLQPMSLHPLAQYRGHPRLYEAPGTMGYPSVSEEGLNSWPQPFA